MSYCFYNDRKQKKTAFLSSDLVGYGDSAAFFYSGQHSSSRARPLTRIII